MYVRLNNNIKTCPKCNHLHGKNGTFCSRTCANSRVWSPLDKEKRSKAAISSEKMKKAAKARKDKVLPLVEKICACGEKFQIKYYSSKQYCSIKCSNLSPKKGGYREGSGRSKSGYYRGIYCGSTYELCWVIYNLDHNIPFSRFEGCIKSDNICYYPDFLLEDKITIVEIKGFEDKERVKRKKDLAIERGYNVNILYKEDLEIMFKYVYEKYNTKNFHTLYDDYAPIYEYTCNNCLSLFQRDFKIKTEIKFCSRKCAGKFRAYSRIQ